LYSEARLDLALRARTGRLPSNRAEAPHGCRSHRLLSGPGLTPIRSGYCSPVPTRFLRRIG